MARHHLSPDPEHGLEEAVAAYRRAVALSDDKIERAKTQIDLAAALCEADQPNDAIDICTDLPKILSREHFPLDWANIELVRADALRILGENAHQRKERTTISRSSRPTLQGRSGCRTVASRGSHRGKNSSRGNPCAARYASDNGVPANDLLKQAILLYDDTLLDLHLRISQFYRRLEMLFLKS